MDQGMSGKMEVISNVVQSVLSQSKQVLPMYINSRLSPPCFNGFVRGFQSLFSANLSFILPGNIQIALIPKFSTLGSTITLLVSCNIIMVEERKDVEFRTVDGLTLRGWLFAGPRGGPAVIVNGAVRQPQTDTSSSDKTRQEDASNSCLPKTILSTNLVQLSKRDLCCRRGGLVWT